MNDLTVHVPVMLDEVIAALSPRPDAILVDGTLGGGGHTRALAERVAPGGRVISLDRDPAPAERAKVSLAGLPVTAVHRSYEHLSDVLRELEVPAVHGILLDLGLSSDQLADAERGFSFHSTGLLDLRFDTSRGEPAWRLVERLSEEHLANVLFELGEERYSRRIARQVVARRRQSSLRTASEFADVVRRSVPRSRHERIDPATRSFQALRIAVNEELKWIKVALKRLPDSLSPGGRMAIISFHSLEDRLVKEAFRDDGRLEVVTRRPVRPTETETMNNPRARSAKLRVAARKRQEVE